MVITTMLELLQLLQLADSALPIGAGSHSFGLETLTAEHELTPDTLSAFLVQMLMESAPFEAACCCHAYRLSEECTVANGDFGRRWVELNQLISARKPARESREASATLGKRFLRLVAGLEPLPRLQAAIESAQAHGADVHHCAAFGLVGGSLGLGEEAVVQAYLQQNLAGLLSACQRLMPVGQNQAMWLSWQLKPLLAQITVRSRRLAPNDAYSFAPLLDLAAMRHANLPVRLFIS